MANVDRLERAENELEAAAKNLEAQQARFKAIQQRVLKLRAERILELVKSAGMGPNEVKELISVYQSGRLLERSGKETEGKDNGDGSQEVPKDVDTY